MDWVVAHVEAVRRGFPGLPAGRSETMLHRRTQGRARLAESTPRPAEPEQKVNVQIFPSVSPCVNPSLCAPCAFAWDRFSLQPKKIPRRSNESSARLIFMTRNRTWDTSPGEQTEVTPDAAVSYQMVLFPGNQTRPARISPKIQPGIRPNPTESDLIRPNGLFF